MKRKPGRNSCGALARAGAAESLTDMRITRPITILGATTIRWLEFLGGPGFTLRDTAVAVPRALFDKRGRRLGWANLWAQMVRVGVKSIPIVSLVVFCIGAILS